MKEHSIYHRQWLSLWLILLLTVISNMLVLTFWLADTVSSEQLLISSGILILSLLALHWNHQVLLKKAEKLIASELTTNQPSSGVFPFLTSAVQQTKDALNKDVDRIKKINSELEHRVLQDNLTGLQNRDYKIFCVSGCLS